MSPKSKFCQNVVARVPLLRAHFDLVNNEWIPCASRAAPAPPASRQQVAPVLEGYVSLASLSELMTQMEGRIMRHFDSVDERLDILEYSVQLLQDDVEDDVDGDDDAPET
ncbi:hypothetical protein V6N13_064308 [Hibiscus sabdariffa]|uniref:Uncharacterized protein n=1 Tax=Hibiscus sabdariffa TaxID=183260 RepID=A0ABR2E9M2_9ROSI